MPARTLAKPTRKAAVEAKSAIDWDKTRQWWPLRPLQSPVVKDAAWPASDIDRFMLARIEESGLKPARDADKRVLIRHASFDLTGPPPTPQEVAEFIADNSNDAFAKVIDRLLDSPAHGERRGRHWLDVVRYADTAGDNSDYPIPQMRRYRDWVIAASNCDQPYDEFVRDQLADDLRGGATDAERYGRIVATGCIGNSRRFGSRVDDYPQHLTIEDTIDNLGRTPGVDGIKGRGHHSACFSSWMAGGRAKGGIAHGDTDELGGAVAKDKVHVHDFHATILHLRGFDHTKLTHRHGGRDYRLTDVFGNVVNELLA